MKKLLLTLGGVILSLTSGAQSVTIEDFTYNFYTSGNAYVEKYNGTATEVTIPATITVDGASKNVTGIGSSAFEGNTTIQKIHLGRNNSYTLGKAAFKGCSALKVLNWASTSGATGNVTTDRFYYPTTSIPESAFEGCSAIDGYIYNRYTNKVSVGKNAFKDCSNATGIYLYSTSIGDNAFEGCSKMQRIYLYSNESIGDNIIKGCSILAYIFFLGNTVPVVSENALVGIPNTAKIDIAFQYISDDYIDAFGDYKGKVFGYVDFNSTVGYVRVLSTKKSLSLNTANYTLYYVSSVEETPTDINVVLTQTPSKVLPKNTALVVKYGGTSASVFMNATVQTTDPTVPYVNYLWPVLEDTEVTPESGINYYQAKTAMAKDATEYFSKVTATSSLNIGSGYLKVVDGSAVTGIKEVKPVKIIGLDNDDIYTLSGVRVTNPTKGIYIRGGKKYVVK